MNRSLIRLAATAAVIVPLAACDNAGPTGGAVQTSSAPAPVPVQGGLQTGAMAPLETLGTGFAALFRAAPNTDPREPVAADTVAVSFTTDPSEIAAF